MSTDILSILQSKYRWHKIGNVDNNLNQVHIKLKHIRTISVEHITTIGKRL